MAWSVGACAALMIALVALGVRSREEDRSDPAVATQLDAQRDAVRAYMTEAFEPQESAGSLRVANASLAAVANPLAARGQKVFGEQSCDVCHGPDGHGSDSGPSLVGAAARHTEGELSRIIKIPTQKMSDSGMHTKLSNTQVLLKAIVTTDYKEIDRAAAALTRISESEIVS